MNLKLSNNKLQNYHKKFMMFNNNNWKRKQHQKKKLLKQYFQIKEKLITPEFINAIKEHLKKIMELINTL